MAGDPISVELLAAQQQAAEVSCPLCYGRGSVIPTPSAGQWRVRINHGRLCPRRPSWEPAG